LKTFSVSLEVLRFDHICSERLLDNYAIVVAGFMLEPRAWSLSSFIAENDTAPGRGDRRSR
jgi:hypothetical protein